MNHLYLLDSVTSYLKTLAGIVSAYIPSNVISITDGQNIVEIELPE
jgi:F0F1-type ATP synthase alpha subunit